MSAVGSGLISQLGEGEFLSVKGVHLSYESTVEHLLGDIDDDSTSTFAVEILVLKDKRIAVRIEQFDTADELQVLTENGELFSALDALAVLLRIAGYHGLSKGKRQA